MTLIDGKPYAVLDTETMIDRHQGVFITEKGELSYEKSDRSDAPLEKIRQIISKTTPVVANAPYERKIVGAFLADASTEAIKDVNDDIIINKAKPWESDFPILDCPMVDVLAIAPGRSALKALGTQIHFPKIEDLPFDPDAILSDEEADKNLDYCRNDVKMTEAIFKLLLPQIKLREHLSKEIGVSLLDASDPKIAEVYLTHAIEAVTKEKLKRPESQAGEMLRYAAPPNITFKDDQLNELVAILESIDYYVLDSGNVKKPDELKGLKYKIGDIEFEPGIGGLHSTEKNISYYATEEIDLLNIDLTSAYPFVIVALGIYPKNVGPAFLDVYKGLIEKRIKAKRNGDDITAQSLKIIVNSTFGKLANQYSRFYEPEQMIKVTLSCQLFLLMLIESLTEEGISCVSANTDGILVRCPKDKRELLEYCVYEWEHITQLGTETTEYQSYHALNVNCYLALKEKSYSVKGHLAPATLGKNPSNDIVTDALVARLRNGIPLEDTIRSCTDITRFINAQKVEGGCLDQAGKMIGKHARWYISTKQKGPLKYAKLGRKVAKSDNAQEVMELPTTFPDDVDYDYYIQEAEKLYEQLTETEVRTIPSKESWVNERKSNRELPCVTS